MDRLPSHHRLAERHLIALVRDGQWMIDADGGIWRTSVRTGLRAGGSRLVPVKQRRVEKQLPSGYLMVRATIDGRRVCGLAHRLVWQHTRGDISPGQTINHRNGLKDDNNPGNLECQSMSDNMSHAHRSGLRDQSGERNPAAKLTDNQVAQIRLAYLHGGYTMKQLAARFGVNFRHISRLVRGQRRAKQGGPTVSADQRHNACDRSTTTGRFTGKKRAGRLLDGVEHNGMPERRP